MVVPRRGAPSKAEREAYRRTELIKAITTRRRRHSIIDVRVQFQKVFMELDPLGIGSISSSVMRQFGETRCTLYATTESSAATRRVEKDLGLDSGRDAVTEVDQHTQRKTTFRLEPAMQLSRFCSEGSH